MRLFFVPLFLVAGVAQAADKIPVAVLWMGEPAVATDSPSKIADELNEALLRSPVARPIDSAENRKLLVTGGVGSEAIAAAARGDALFVKLKFAEAVKEYEKAEALILSSVPVAMKRQRLGAIERNLLVLYDQLGRHDDAARAVERLSWTAGENDDLKPQILKYAQSRMYEPIHPAVKVTSQPEGAAVFRNLTSVGATPNEVAGGNPWVDIIDIESPGYRPIHLALPTGHGSESVQVTLEIEDRLWAIVDQIRARAPDAPAKEVADLGHRLGAARVLVIMSDGPGKLLARVLEVNTAKWATDTFRSDAQGQPAMDKLANYAVPAPALVQVVPAKAPPKKKGAWGKWYTWVAAAGVVALVGGLLIADHVGDDKVNVSASH